MGICESTANLPQHISQHSVERLSENPSETSKLKAIQHNHLIDKAKGIIDAANEKIHTLQERCKEYKSQNSDLEAQLSSLQTSESEKDKVSHKYKEQLDVQRETMLKWKEKIQTLSEEIVNIEQERKENDLKYRNNLLSINDSLYKVHGDTVSKLRFNKQSKKFVVFTDKINHLFYYDENGPKFMVIKSITVDNHSIAKQMKRAWFLVTGDKRSALFTADSKLVRDKWVGFIRKSLAQLGQLQIIDTNQAKCFGKSQSPINIVSSVHSSHTKVMDSKHSKSNPLRFSYPSSISHCTVANNGHTVQVNITQGMGTQCSVWINNQVYELRQFHFHTPSEHTIDNRQYEMEMHLVHVNAETQQIAVLGFIFTTQQKYSKPKLELTKSRAHLVLKGKGKGKTHKSKKHKSRHLQIEESDFSTDEEEWSDEESESESEKETKKSNDFLQQFWDELPMERTEKDILLSRPLSFDYLFETASNNFSKNVSTNEIEIDMEIFEYMGSLTTPPYTEGVQWMVSKYTHFISSKQLRKLSQCWGNECNARPVQEYFGRTVSLRSKSSLRVV